MHRFDAPGDDGLPELSVGHPSQADVNFDLEELDDSPLGASAQQSGQRVSFLAPDGTLLPTHDDEDGSVKIHEGSSEESGPGSSLSFGNSDNATSSPVMFTTGRHTELWAFADRRIPVGGDQVDMDVLDSPTVDDSPVIRQRGLDPSEFANLGNASESSHEVESSKQTMESMVPDTDVSRGTLSDILLKEGMHCSLSVSSHIFVCLLFRRGTAI